MVYRKVLKNGIVVLFLKTRHSKTIALNIVIKAGSNNEKKGDSGVAHFVEHLLFNGNQKFKTAQELSNQIDKIGGTFNGITDYERTTYIVKVPKKYFKKALAFLSNLIEKPLFEEKEIEKEKQVILNEIKISKDDPEILANLALFKQLFKNQPLAKQPLGYEKDIKKINRNKILEFYEENYAPNNMIISIIGNISAPFTQVLKEFKRKPVKIVKVGESFPIGLERTIIKRLNTGKFDYKTILIGYENKGLKDKNYFSLKIIEAILAKGLSGRLIEKLRNEAGISYEVSVNNNNLTNQGIFTIKITTDKTNVKKAIKLTLDELKELKKITSQEINDAKRYIEGEVLTKSEFNSWQAKELSDWEIASKLKNFRNYLKEIKRINKKQIINAAKSQFDKKPIIIIVD